MLIDDPTVERGGSEEEVETCETCGGSGEVSIFEAVYYREPHIAEIGIRPCVCTIETVEDMDDDS